MTDVFKDFRLASISMSIPAVATPAPQEISRYGGSMISRRPLPEHISGPHVWRLLDGQQSFGIAHRRDADAAKQALRADIACAPGDAASPCVSIDLHAWRLALYGRSSAGDD